MKRNFLSCHNSFLLVSGWRKAALMAALVCLAVSAVSCRSVKEVSVVTDTIVKTDTTEIYVHDTVRVLEVRFDSVDRFIEKTVYVDSNGVVHEKEVERYIRYIHYQDELYKAMEAFYKAEVAELQKRIEESDKSDVDVEKKTEYIEKEPSWFNKTMVAFGWCFVLAVVLFGVYVYFKLKKKTR